MNNLEFGSVLPLTFQKLLKDGFDTKEMIHDQTLLLGELSKWPSEKVKDLAVDMLVWTKYWPNEAFVGSTTSATGHAPKTASNSTTSELQDSSAIVETQPLGGLIATSPAASLVQDHGPQSLSQVTFSADSALPAMKTNGCKGIKLERAEATDNLAQEEMGPRQPAAEVEVSSLLDFRHPK